MTHLINMTDKYVTQDGNPVRILCVDFNIEVHDKYPVIACFPGSVGGEYIGYLTPTGQQLTSDLHPVIIVAPHKRIIKRWVNVYEDYEDIWMSERIARKNAASDILVVAVPVEFEVEY